MKEFTVIIPTLNEGDSIARLVSELLKKYPSARVIVSDDGSTDGTREAIRRLAKKEKRVALLDRTDCKVHGLTASAIDGALKARTEFVVVMDGDLQHPPEKVGEMVGMLGRGADVAVGYRTKFGRDWNLYRKTMSKTAEVLGHTALKLRRAPSCKDVLSGFFAVKRKLLVGAYKKTPAAFELKGYKVLLDLLKLLPERTKIADVGYEFGVRSGGQSKIGAKQVLRYLRSLAR